MWHDVVIAGASIAGCTAAIEFGRAGLRVALVEKHRSAETAKGLCGHFVLAGAEPMLCATGLWDAMVAAGAATGRPQFWTEWGWTVPPTEDLPQVINLRRTKLDPLLRRIAAETPGVDLHLGHTVTDLITEGGRIVGVRARRLNGGSEDFRGQLVVGADGYRSRVVELANVREHVGANNRFLCFGYYRDIERDWPTSMRIWFWDRDIAVAGPTDDGLTQVAIMATKDQLPEFQRDRAAATRRYMSRLPGGPDLADSEPVGKMQFCVDYPLIRRHPTPRPGLALIGDAALTTDPTPAPGCGWAFRTGALLVEATAASLADGGDVDRALRAYRRDHRFFERHHRLIAQDALAKAPNPLQRILRAASTRDEEIARRTYLFGMQSGPMTGLLNPKVIARAAWVTGRTPRRAPALGATGSSTVAI